MALSPIIPTSFVPNSKEAPRRFHTDFGNAFGLFSYTVLFITFALAIGVFFYGRILSNIESSRAASVDAAEKSIDRATIEEFVRLRDRLDSGSKLLANHTVFSGFFALLEKLMPSSFRFTSLHMSLDDARVAKIEGTGAAKSFNALAAASAAFASDGRIKDVIFSNIVVSQKDSSVSFAITASLDPKLTIFEPSVSAGSSAIQP